MIPPFPPISKLKAGGTDARKAVAISIGYYRQPPTLRWGSQGLLSASNWPCCGAAVTGSVRMCFPDFYPWPWTPITVRGRDAVIFPMRQPRASV